MRSALLRDRAPKHFSTASSGPAASRAGREGAEGQALIGRFGVGFYSAFMVAERVEVISQRAGSDAAWLWSSDGKGDFSITPAAGA